MNMMIQKPKSASPVNGADLLAALERRIKEMSADDRSDLELQIALEKSARPEGVFAADVAQANALIDGEEFVPRAHAISALATVMARRKTRALALKIAHSKQHQMATELAGEIWAAHFPEIAELEKRRVLVALELQRVNRAREKLRDKIAALGGSGFLPTDSVDLLGLGDRDEEVKWACERLIDDGIASRGEIAKARS
jgi:hypothetical protein